MDLKRKIALIIAIVIEALLLFVIFIILLIALLGAAMPFMPGLLFVALAALIYSFMVKIGYTRLTYRAHPYYFSAQSKILNLKITKKIMKLLKKIKKKKNEKIKEEILKHGLILIGFNLALILLFLFGFRGLSLLAALFGWRGLLVAFLPLTLIFVFAGVSAVVWYRFGQILGARFKENKMINASLTVLVSLLPLLLILLLFSNLANILGGFGSQFLAILFLGFLLMSILAAAFELVAVSLGAITKIK